MATRFPNAEIGKSQLDVWLTKISSKNGGALIVTWETIRDELNSRRNQSILENVQSDPSIPRNLPPPSYEEATAPSGIPMAVQNLLFNSTFNVAPPQTPQPASFSCSGATEDTARAQNPPLPAEWAVQSENTSEEPTNSDSLPEPVSRNTYYRHNSKGQVEEMFYCPYPQCPRSAKGSSVRSASNLRKLQGFRSDNLRNHLTIAHTQDVQKRRVRDWLQENFPGYFTKENETTDSSSDTP